MAYKPVAKIVIALPFATPLFPQTHAAFAGVGLSDTDGFDA